MINTSTLVLTLLLCSTICPQLVNSYATDTGVIPIKDYYGVYTVQVDQTNHANSANDPSYGRDTIDMMLALYTPISIFTGTCLNFTNLLADNPISGNWDSTNSLELLNFRLGGAPMTLNANLDYTYWSIKDTTNCYFATNSNCHSNAFLYGIDTAGLIGMGNRLSTNFLATNIFSIYLASDSSGGKLIFATDFSYAESETPMYVLNTNDNWIVSNIVNISMQSVSSNNKSTIPMNNFAYMLLFDINTDIISFPLATYTQIIQFLKPYVIGITDINAPMGTNITSIENFPAITIWGPSNQAINITPQQYVEPVSYGNRPDQVVLNLRGCDPYQYGVSYVTGAYRYAIVIGSKYMKNFYTVFDGSVPQVRLYPVKIPDPPIVSNSTELTQ